MNKLYTAIRFSFVSLVVLIGLVASANAQVAPTMDNGISASTGSQTSSTMYGSIISTGGANITTAGFEYGTGGSYGNTASYGSGSWASPFPFSVPVSGLSCGTTYNYRSYATNAAGFTGRSSGTTFATAACSVSAPSVGGISASSGQYSATMYASIDSTGGENASTAGFEYGTGGSYGSTASYGYGSFDTIPFSVSISSLSCGTTYNYRAYATNSAGTGRSSGSMFTTSSCPSSVVTPTVTWEGANPVSYNGVGTAFFYAYANDGNEVGNVTYGFDYGLTTSYGTRVSDTSTAQGAGSFNKSVSGFTCGNTYHVRAFETNSAGTGYSSDRTFTTEACPVFAPTVGGISAGNPQTPTSITMYASISATGGATPTSWGFEYSTDTSYSGSVYVSGSGGTGFFSNTANNLSCNTTYNYRAFATNSAGTGRSSSGTFTTQACPVVAPTVITFPATALQTSASFYGFLGDTGGATVTAAGHQYGLTTAYGGGNIPATGPFSNETYFSNDISGLACNTTYHYRAYATNSASLTGYSIDKTFTTTACRASLGLLSAVVTDNSSAMSSSVTSTGGATVTQIGFDYGLNSYYGTWSSYPIGSYGVGPFSRDATGLSCNTTYYYRAFAKNSAGDGYSSPGTFSTASCPLGPPTLADPTSTSIGYYSATLTSEMTNNGGANATEIGFEYDSLGTYTGKVKYNGSFGATGPYNYIITSGLACGTTYYYRAYAINPYGTGRSDPAQFTTLACPIAPSLGATSAGDPQSPTSVTMYSSIANRGTDWVTVMGFRWGTAAGSYTLGSDSYTGGTWGTGQNFSKTATGLICNTTYHYQAFATSVSGNTNSPDATFTTAACPVFAPTVSAPSATVTGQTTASLSSSILTTGGANSTSVGFDYGLTTSYGGTVSSAGSYGVGSFSNNLTGLTCNTTYHYRAFATNSAGTTNSGDATFTTSVCGAAGGATATNITSTSATLNSSIVSGSGITARGFFVRSGATYGSSPTVSENGSFGVGAYSLGVTGLSPNTTYYFKAFIDVGGNRYFGSEQNFTTSQKGNYVSGVDKVDIGAGAKAYGNGRFDHLGATSASLADLAILPQDPSLAYSADATISTWNKTAPFRKRWTVSVTGNSGVVVNQIVGDLSPTKSYTVSYVKNGLNYNIGVYQADASGRIQFTYSGGFSSIEFDVNGIPSGLSGWAWSSTVGWFNLDSIAVEAATGNLNGYSWSPNIGWLKFGGLTGNNPVGQPVANANINFNTGEVKGWIRACAGTVGGDCSSMDSRTDGWDGWIELSGSNHSSYPPSIGDPVQEAILGVTLDRITGELLGKAWGGPVVGWLDFGDTVASTALGVACSGVLVGRDVIYSASPSGGSTEYEYLWDGTGGNSGWITSSSRTITSAMGSGDTVTQSVTVRDARTPSSTFGPVTCQPPSINRGGGDPIRGSCDITGANASKVLTVPVNTLVRFTATPNGGTGTYNNYAWSTGFGNSNTAVNTFSDTYISSGTYNTSVTVTDSGSVSSVPPLICGQVVVEADELDLFIGDTGPTANRKTYPIRQGAKFGLRWKNTLAENPDYSCIAFISNGGGTYWSDWQTAAATVKTNPNVSAVKSYNDTNGVPLGEYDFKIRCEKKDFSSYKETQPVKLKIVSVSEGEI